MLDGRYRLDRQLGGDLLGASYLATRVADGVVVRARAYRVRSDAALQVRLARLRELDHPALPRRLDELTIGEAMLATQWLIDERRPGQTLADAIAAAADHRVDAPRVAGILRELAELFDALGRLPSPIVHGALTPHSILTATGERGACLLDLGLPSELVRASNTRGLADSLGYSAPEQLYAEATPAADVWALGAIAVVALSGASLSSMRDSAATLRWRERVEVSPGFARTLAQMLEPDPDERIHAGEVSRALAEIAEATRGQHHGRPRRGTTGLAKTNNPAAEVPVMRPDELSHELSQAHQATAALAQQQRTRLIVARTLVVLVAAIIATLATYIAITLS